jgi:hypothetical protein
MEYIHLSICHDGRRGGSVRGRKAIFPIQWKLCLFSNLLEASISEEVSCHCAAGASGNSIPDYRTLSSAQLLQTDFRQNISLKRLTRILPTSRKDRLTSSPSVMTFSTNGLNRLTIRAVNGMHRVNRIVLIIQVLTHRRGRGLCSQARLGIYGGTEENNPEKFDSGPSVDRLGFDSGPVAPTPLTTTYILSAF